MRASWMNTVKPAPLQACPEPHLPDDSKSYQTENTNIPVSITKQEPQIMKPLGHGEDPTEGMPHGILGSGALTCLVMSSWGQVSCKRCEMHLTLLVFQYLESLLERGWLMSVQPCPRGKHLSSLYILLKKKNTPKPKLATVTLDLRCLSHMEEL